MSIEPDRILDQAIAQIRTEEMDTVAVEQAAARVWQKVSAPVLRTCADFQALLPDYRTRQLADAQVWLLEDHLHGCPACRSAAAARSEKVVEFPARRALAPQWKWAMAAALAVGVGIGTWQMRDNLL